MAIDTKEKRLSMLNFGLPWWTTLPVTDGSFDVGDRLHFLHLYSGIDPDAPVVVTPTYIFTAESRSLTDTAESRSLTDTAGARPLLDTADRTNRVNQ